MRGAWSGNSRGIGAGLCRILDMNFREFVFYEVGWISPCRLRYDRGRGCRMLRVGG
jgi:hypothetical protein